MNSISFALLRYISTAILVLALFQGNAIARANGACLFETLEGWKTEDVRWVGDCSRGQASGLGVLRHFVDGKVENVFYGRLEKGVPKLGAIDLVANGGGYKAGEFAKGQLVERENDFDARFRGLDEAVKSALFVAKRFEKEGNKASAKYYRDKAKMWELQIR